MLNTTSVDTRALFVIPESCIYFDCAYKGLTPLKAAAAAAQSPTVFDGPWTSEHAEQLRTDLTDTVARLVGLGADDLALIPSASYGMALARGLVRLGPGDEVLLLDTEHPASVLPWYAACRLAGATVRPVSTSIPDLTEAILTQLSPAVKVVNIPHAHWIDGRPIELDEVARRARELGALLIVDATQSVGGRPFDIPASKADVVTFSGYKWLLGPIGVAYFYLAPPLRALAPFEHSWISYAGKDTSMFDEGGAIQRPRKPPDSMQRFDASGLHNPLTLRMALAGATLVREIGPERILEHNATIISRLRREFPDQVPSTTTPCHFTGVRVRDPRRVARLLAARSIHASARGRFLRISPNVWNDESDLETLISQLRPHTSHAFP
jgi:selenocysteine lyase/cysteine desulfurase